MSPGTARARRTPPATVLVLAAIVSVQFGGALAATLIPRIGVVGSVAFRLVLGAGVLVALTRPTWRGHSRSSWATVIAKSARPVIRPGPPASR